MKMNIVGLSVAVAGALVTPSKACDLCAIYSAVHAQGASGKGWFGGAAEQFTHFGTMQENGQRVPNEIGQRMDSFVTQVFAGYNFNDKIGLQFNLPVIFRSFERPRGTVIDRGTESGLGDISLLGTYRLYHKMEDDFSFNWTLLGGIKIPTGNSNRLGEPDVPSAGSLTQDSGIAGHDLALGSGSFDGIIGTGVSVRWKRSFLTANTQYAIRTKGDFNHQYANDLTWSGGPGVYLVLKDKYTISLQAVISGEYKGKDSFGGVPDGDSAGTIVYVGPQINFTWSDRLALSLGADLPVSIYNSGLQTVPDYRVRAAFNWRF